MIGKNSTVTALANTEGIKHLPYILQTRNRKHQSINTVKQKALWLA